MRRSDNRVRACTCCAFVTILEEYDICPDCYWEADDVQERDPTFSGGANTLCLEEAQATYRAVRASDDRFRSKVRPPLSVEHPHGA
jgi:hypothetical protein